MLFDCNKKPCCTDVIGAKHVNYDLLVHFGEACFSEQFQKQHYYVLPCAEDLEQRVVDAEIKLEQFGCDAVLLGQRYYTYGK
jgi:diphthamide biosynthesis enzyme Dph1/Dph2-like protein